MRAWWAAVVAAGAAGTLFVTATGASAAVTMKDDDQIIGQESATGGAKAGTLLDALGLRAGTITPAEVRNAVANAQQLINNPPGCENISPNCPGTPRATGSGGTKVVFVKSFTAETPADDNQTYQYGVWKWYFESGDSDPDYDYYLDTFKAVGYAKGNNSLQRLKARTQIDNGGRNTDWSPAAGDVNVGSPIHTTYTIGLSAPGFTGSSSYSYDFYPGRQHTFVSSTVFHNSWIDNTGYGCFNTEQEADGASEARVNQGDPVYFHYGPEAWYYD
jgi:hypothetical protein